MSPRRPVALLVALSLFSPACGDTDAMGPSQIALLTGRQLGLGPADRLVPGFTVGVWQGSVEGGRATIFERHLDGEEAASGHRIVLDLGEDPPRLIELVSTDTDARGRDLEEPAGRGALALQDTDPTGVISGEYTGASGGSFRFWVDTADATYADQPAPGETFRLRPGGVADSGSFATQFVGVVDDSRCPPDVECIWEGQVVLAMRQVWESGTEDFELRGFLTPDGPIFGDAATHPNPPAPGAETTLAIALVGLDGDVATFEWVPTG